MKILGRIAIAVAVLAALVVTVSFFLPKTFAVERTISVEASAETIQPLLSDLKNGWSSWEPWTAEDSTIVVTFDEIYSGVGAHQSWTDKSGGGELTLTEVVEGSGVTYDMSFNQGQYLSVGSIRYVETASGLEVTWRMSGDADGVIGKYFGLAMDSMVGPMFESGLQNLKRKAEDG